MAVSILSLRGWSSCLDTVVVPPPEPGSSFGLLKPFIRARSPYCWPRPLHHPRYDIITICFAILFPSHFGHPLFLFTLFRPNFTGLIPPFGGTTPTPHDNPWLFSFPSKRIFTNLRLSILSLTPVYALPPYLSHPLFSCLLSCAAAVDVAVFAWAS